MARPTKYSDELATQICKALTAGNTRKDSYTMAGISADTFAAWLKRFSAFLVSVKAAEAEARVRNVAIINNAAVKNWKAAAWWLERKDPDNWRARSQVDLVDLRKLSDEDFEAYAEIAERAALASSD